MHYQPQLNLLDNRIILVTGASDGIGQEAAITYARHGASVIYWVAAMKSFAPSPKKINQAGAIPARWFTLDLLTCTPQECQQLAQKISVHYPRLDGVLHNAGLWGDVVPNGGTET
ncbi:SDR family NAD(P)-dependent oxidoreductase [Escherichia coli]